MSDGDVNGILVWNNFLADEDDDEEMKTLRTESYEAWIRRAFIYTVHGECSLHGCHDILAILDMLMRS